MSSKDSGKQIKLYKSDFSREEIEFLENGISPEGITTNPIRREKICPTVHQEFYETNKAFDEMPRKETQELNIMKDLLKLLNYVRTSCQMNPYYIPHISRKLLFLLPMLLILAFQQF